MSPTLMSWAIMRQNSTNGWRPRQTFWGDRVGRALWRVRKEPASTVPCFKIGRALSMLRPSLALALLAVAAVAASHWSPDAPIATSSPSGASPSSVHAFESGERESVMPDILAAGMGWSRLPHRDLAAKHILTNLMRRARLYPGLRRLRAAAQSERYDLGVAWLRAPSACLPALLVLLST